MSRVEIRPLAVITSIPSRTVSLLIRTHSTNSGLFYSLANDEYACWGVTVNLNQWRNMNVGDICLMYREKRFFSAGKIILPFKDEQLAKHLWSTKDDGSTWENMFLIDLKEVSIPIANFNRLMSYKPNFVVLPGYFPRIYQKLLRNSTSSIGTHLSSPLGVKQSKIGNKGFKSNYLNLIKQTLKVPYQSVVLSNKC